MGNFAVYLIIYSGQKHPPFYIGSTTIKRLENGYRGSVRSSRWKDVYAKEVKENPEAYSYYILARTDSRKHALELEKKLQLFYNVVKSDLYVNRAIASVNGFFGVSMKGENNPMHGKRASDKTKEAISKSNSGKVSVTEDGINYFKVTTEEYHSAKHKYSTPKGEFNQATSDAVRQRVKDGLHHFQNPDTINKIHELRKLNGFKQTDETKEKLSFLAKERLKNWNNKNLQGCDNLWLLAPDLFELFLNNKFFSAKAWRKPLIEDWVNKYPILVGRQKWMFKLAAKFKKGWIPVNDESYMDWRLNESS